MGQLVVKEEATTSSYGDREDRGTIGKSDQVQRLLSEHHELQKNKKVKFKGVGLCENKVSSIRVLDTRVGCHKKGKQGCGKVPQEDRYENRLGSGRGHREQKSAGRQNHKVGKTPPCWKSRGPGDLKRQANRAGTSGRPSSTGLFRTRGQVKIKVDNRGRPCRESTQGEIGTNRRNH